MGLFLETSLMHGSVEITTDMEENVCGKDSGACGLVAVSLTV